MTAMAMVEWNGAKDELDRLRGNDRVLVRHGVCEGTNDGQMILLGAPDSVRGGRWSPQMQKFVHGWMVHPTGLRDKPEGDDRDEMKSRFRRPVREMVRAIDGTAAAAYTRSI